VTGRRRAIEFLMTANSLEEIPRTGYQMSGVPDPESVAAHTCGMAVAALLIADRVAEPVDRGRLLTMALLHDIGETVVGDVALIAKTAGDDEREREAARGILSGLPGYYLEIYEEYEARKTLESRIVKAADKLQMMAKVLAYESEGRGDLNAFWDNPRNFDDAGIREAGELFDEVRARKRALHSAPGAECKADSDNLAGGGLHHSRRGSTI
jgi:putative hydrolase of HD superfamily